MPDVPSRRAQLLFSKGETTPLVEGRTDLQPLQAACRRLKNMQIEKTGGVSRRPGLQYVDEVATGSAVSGGGIIAEVTFSLSQGYNINISDSSGDHVWNVRFTGTVKARSNGTMRLKGIVSLFTEAVGDQENRVVEYGVLIGTDAADAAASGRYHAVVSAHAASPANTVSIDTEIPVSAGERVFFIGSRATGTSFDDLLPEFALDVGKYAEGALFPPFDLPVAPADVPTANQTKGIGVTCSIAGGQLSLVGRCAAHLNFDSQDFAVNIYEVDLSTGALSNGIEVFHSNPIGSGTINFSYAIGPSSSGNPYLVAVSDWSVASGQTDYGSAGLGPFFP